LVLALDPALPPTLRGDDLRLRQVLTNLVSNAIKFTPSGGTVSIAVSVPRDETKHGTCAIRCEVRDTGKGISRQARERLFTEFTQEDASTAREFGGTGLGLALCRQLVGLMSGHIGVESELGQGSAFWVELGLPVVADKEPACTQ
jgi:signal transduction histidine kinase